MLTGLSLVIPQQGGEQRFEIRRRRNPDRRRRLRKHSRVTLQEQKCERKRSEEKPSMAARAARLGLRLTARVRHEAASLRST
jgi:hypothetical protein